MGNGEDSWGGTGAIVPPPHPPGAALAAEHGGHKNRSSSGASHTWRVQNAPRHPAVRGRPPGVERGHQRRLTRRGRRWARWSGLGRGTPLGSIRSGPPEPLPAGGPTVTDVDGEEDRTG